LRKQGRQKSITDVLREGGARRPGPKTRHQADACPWRMRLAAPAGHPMSHRAFAGERVLVAEGEPLIALELNDLLEQEGATVLPVRSVLVASRCLSAGVVDVRLNDEDVDPLCQALSRDQVPFVFYTGMSGTHERWPAAPVVQKPATAAANVGA